MSANADKQTSHGNSHTLPRYICSLSTLRIDIDRKHKESPKDARKPVQNAHINARVWTRIKSLVYVSLSVPLDTGCIHLSPLTSSLRLFVDKNSYPSSASGEMAKLALNASWH